MGKDSQEISPSYKLDSYDFNVPEELIAKEPIEPRDHARLLMYNRADQSITHHYFYELPELLPKNLALVLNNSKVFLARTMARKKESTSTSNIEVLFVRDLGNHRWETLMRPGKRMREGQHVIFADGSEAKLISKGDAVCVLEWNNTKPQEFFEKYGQLPLPPYLAGSHAKKSDYQTVYANSIGSSAAPTAGLHFTDVLLRKLAKSHPLHYVTLHVGLGTFKPVQKEDIREHTMHEEYVELSGEVADALNAWKVKDGDEDERWSEVGAAKSCGGTGKMKICAVGTTSLRTLETAFKNGKFQELHGSTDLYLYPGKKLHTVDMLITNFHTPKSSLFILIASIVGLDEAKRIYQEAIDKKYRFFSFGDAMLIV